MNDRTASRLAWFGLGLSAVLGAAGCLLVWSNWGATGIASADLIFSVFVAVAGVGYATVGALIASRRRNAVGWILLFIGSMFALVSFMIQYAVRGLIGTGSLPAAKYAAWFSSWGWIPSVGAIPLLLLLFPTGRLPSARWRPMLWFLVLGVAVSVTGFALKPEPLEPVTGLRIPNPLGVEGWRGLISTVLVGSAWATLVPAASSLVALVLRFRRGTPEERQQIKWLSYAAAAAAGILLFTFGSLVACRCNNPPGGDALFIVFLSVLSFGIPGAVGVAVLKYRLYDIDVIIRKTILYAALAGFFTLVYLAIVVGIGTAVGSRSNAFLTMLAAVIVAVVFQPARRRASHLANRLIYGKRATPYEVLSEFSERMVGTQAAEQMLPRMAQILGEGTGARRAEVWLKVGSELRPAASWPSGDGSRAGPLSIPGEDLPDIPEVDEALPVRHQGELLGALAVAMPPSEPITPTQQKLLSDLASQAGLVLRNAKLIEELRASRTRLVAAQDQERRRLERNIHDGAQQQLVALAVKVKLAQAVATRDPQRTESILSEVQSDAQDALENLRDLARGIYPPLLADQGLLAALRAQARKVPVPVTVDAAVIGRYPQEAEAAVYFCCLEALQNVAKYADASSVRVRLGMEDGQLTFEVSDDGRGFEAETTPLGSGMQNMADRLAALGGSIEVQSNPGTGTTVRGRIPVPDS
jgi:signal transduction histidine kinase